MTDLTLWRETMLLQIRYREKENQRVIAAILLLCDLEDENTKPHLLVPPADSPMYQFFEARVAEVLAPVTPDYTQDQVWDLILDLSKGWNA